MLVAMVHIPPQALFVLLRAATTHISGLMETKGSKLNKEHDLVLKDMRAQFPNSKIVAGKAMMRGPFKNHREEHKGVVEYD